MTFQLVLVGRKFNVETLQVFVKQAVDFVVAVVVSVVTSTIVFEPNVDDSEISDASWDGVRDGATVSPAIIYSDL